MLCCEVKYTHAVPAFDVCNASVSTNGAITVNWSYIHTGGLPLTNISLFYMFEEGSTIGAPNIVPVGDINTTSVTLVELQPGYRYTFNITAENSNGTSNILCGVTVHNILLGESLNFRYEWTGNMEY